MAHVGPVYAIWQYIRSAGSFCIDQQIKQQHDKHDPYLIQIGVATVTVPRCALASSCSMCHISEIAPDSHNPTELGCVFDE